MKNNQTDKIMYNQEPFSSDTIGGDPNLFLRSQKTKTVHWSIAWSDLMMTMFVMFLVMYLYHTVKTEITVGTGQPLVGEGKTKHVTSFKKGTTNSRNIENTDVKLTVKAGTVLDIADVDLVSDRTVRIVLPGDLFFDNGQADIKSIAKNSLKNIAGIIKKTPYIVNVVGHTDNIPIHSKKFTTNWELSVARACEVARFLIEEMKISNERFYVTGHAYNVPVATNNTKNGRSQNRRVEIIITKELPQNRRWHSTDFKENMDKIEDDTFYYKF